MKQILAVDWEYANPEPFMSINTVSDDWLAQSLLISTPVRCSFEVCGEITSSYVVRESDLKEPMYSRNLRNAQNLWAFVQKENRGSMERNTNVD